VRAVVLLIFLALSWPASAAVERHEFLADPALEARARALSKQIRCLVCQSESIDTSNAELARDLRILVRERIEAGDSDEQVLDYLVAHYGDFVLLNPPLKLKTVLLWFGPFMALGVGVGVLLYLVRRRRGITEAVPLNPEERARLMRLLGTEQAP
jgi:cytochrome c-type biogenesis protein CcmH